MRVTAETKRATRQRILDVAKKLFARKGFDLTTTRDIAQAAEIGVGTLFNYFTTKESIVQALVDEACGAAIASTASEPGQECEQADHPLTLEEELFAQAAVVLRKLKPYRKYVYAVLETTLSPLAESRADHEAPSFRTVHLENIYRIASRHLQQQELSPVALQLYWTLFTGVLTFWSRDRSPRQEDTLALLDQSLAMYVGWLESSTSDSSEQP